MIDSCCLLDLDGTLTDPFEGISRCIAHALIALGYPVPESAELKSWIGPPLHDSFEQYFKLHGGGDPGEAVRLYRERFANRGLYENQLYDGIPGTLQKLQRDGWVLMLATAKPTVYAKRIISHFGLDRWLHAVHGSELDGRLTNKTDLLEHIRVTHGLDPLRCTMVGDREFDMAAARHHEMKAIGVLWGYGSRIELQNAGAQALVSTPGELEDLLIDAQ